MKAVNKNKILPFISIFLVAACNTLSASQEWAEDIQQYRSAVFDADKSYSATERETAEALLSNLEKQYSSLSNSQIELALAEISAVTNNGHSFLMPGGWTHRYARLPISFYVFAEGVFVVSATADYENLIGHQLLAINGHSTEALSDAWSRYQGDSLAGETSTCPIFSNLLKSFTQPAWQRILLNLSLS